MLHKNITIYRFIVISLSYLIFYKNEFISLRNPCDKSSCSPVFGFKHQLPITDDGEKFKTVVSETTISGNIDSPEGGFDALMQIAVCQVGGNSFVNFFSMNVHI